MSPFCLNLGFRFLVSSFGARLNLKLRISPTIFRGQDTCIKMDFVKVQLTWDNKSQKPKLVEGWEFWSLLNEYEHRNTY